MLILPSLSVGHPGERWWPSGAAAKDAVGEVGWSLPLAYAISEPAAPGGEGGQRDRDRADARGRARRAPTADGPHAVGADRGCRRGCRVRGRVRERVQLAGHRPADRRPAA